jgi:DivIVA domain-containing protein
LVFGRGEQLAPLSPRVSPTELPDSEMTADDVRKVRFAMALRGYRMSDVDWALERMAAELDRLRGQLAELSGVAADPTDDLERRRQTGPSEFLTGASSIPNSHGSSPAADLRGPDRSSGEKP